MNKKILLAAFFLGFIFFANGAEAGCGSSARTYEVNDVPTPDSATWGTNRCNPPASVNDYQSYSKTFPIKPGDVSKWTCGTDTTTVCTASKKSTYTGKCGPGANKTYTISETNWSGELCSVGARRDISPTVLAFPSPGQTVSWKCLGGWEAGSTDDANCWAKREENTVQKPDITFRLNGTGPFKVNQSIPLFYTINKDCVGGECLAKEPWDCKISISGAETRTKSVASIKGEYSYNGISISLSGDYTLKLSCFNAVGVSEVPLSNIKVIDDQNNPVAVIVSPKEGESVVAGQAVQFVGSGAGTGGTYKWCSGMDCGCGSILLATTNDPSGFKRTFLESQVNNWNSTALVVKTANGKESEAVRRRVNVTSNPICNNGVKDPGEFGVDCGGLCELCDINLSAPTNLKGTCSESGLITFSWSSAPNAEKYELRVKKENSGIASPYQLRKSDIIGTTYNWQGEIGTSYIFSLKSIIENGVEDIESSSVISNVSCSGEGVVTPDDLCGEAAGNYSASDTHFRGSGICLECKLCVNKRAEPEYLKFPDPGKSVSWVCKDDNGVVEAECRAERSGSSSDDEQFSCYGNIPENASIWETNGAKDDQGLTSSSLRVLSATNTDRKCEYKCNQYYKLSSNRCVPDFSDNSCLGNTPQNATLCEGDDKNIEQKEVYKKVVPQCTIKNKCEYVCNNWQNYDYSGGSCRKSYASE